MSDGCRDSMPDRPDKPRTPGRPAKGYENLHCEVTPTAREIITKVADTFNMSQGEAVSWMAIFFRDGVKEKLRADK